MKGDPLPLASFSFWVNVEPVPKSRARVMGGYAFTPPRTRAFEKAVADAAMEARPLSWPLDARYRLRVAVYRARKSGDLVNFVCSVQDAGNKGVMWTDDRQVIELECKMFDDRDDPCVYVEVWAYEPERQKRRAA